MAHRKGVIRHSAFVLAIKNRKSTFRNSRRGHSSVGRAPALQAGSQGFESPCLQSFEETWSKNTPEVDALAGATSPCLHFIFNLRFLIADLSNGPPQNFSRNG